MRSETTCSWFKAVGGVLAVALATMATTGVVRAEDAPPRAPEPSCASGCLVLTSMLIQGVSAYPLAELATTYDHQLARQVTVDDLVQSATAITERYRRDGYFLTRAVVAETDALAGSARIVVLEGYLSDLQIEGEGADAVRPILKPLLDRRPLTIGELDRRLALARDVPGVRLTSRIEPVIGDPAGHRLVVVAETTPGGAGLYVDNRGSDAQGPWQVYLSANTASTFTAGDRLSMAALTVPDSPDELVYADLGYSLPLGAAGTRLGFNVSGYKTDAPAQNRNGWVGGSSRMASVTVAHPLVRTRDDSLWVNAGLDVRRVGQHYVATGHAEETIAVVRVSLAGRKQYGPGYVAGSVQVSKGVDAFGATTRPSSLNTRTDATGQFTKVSGQVSAYRDVGKYAGVYVEASGQWSHDPLLGSEEFFVGGPTFGRAYDYGETSGDKAAAVMVEARVGYDPKGDLLSFAQAYAFFDAARVWNVAPGNDWTERLASAGVGSRLTFGKDTTLRIELAKPLSRVPYNEADDGWRTFVSLSRQF